MNPKSPRPSIDALTSLRGIAAVLVVVHHMGLLMLPLGRTIAQAPLQKCGLLGMSVFFVLSGFVIHYNYGERLAFERERGIMAFLFARFARLYPLYVPVILVNYFLNIDQAISTGNPVAASAYSTSLPVYLAGMQSWFYSTFNGFNLSISQEFANNSWSISAELFLYLLFIPLALCAGFKIHSVKRGIIVTIGAILARVAFVKFSELDAVRNALEHGLGAVPSMSAGHWLVYYSPYGRFFEFLAGLGLAEIWLGRNLLQLSAKARMVSRILGLVALCYIAGSFFDRVAFELPRLYGGDRIYSGYAITLPAAIYAICDSRRWLGRLAKAWPLIFAGDISYSLYLLHGNIFPYFEVQYSGDWSAQAPEMAIKSILFLVTLFIASWLVYRFWEIPARRWVLGFYRNSITPSSAPPSGTADR